MFEFTDRTRTRDADPDPAALAGVQAGWRVLVGRDRRPMGVRLTLRRTGTDPIPPLSVLLDTLLSGLTLQPDEQPVFPQGLIVLALRDFEVDAAMSEWRAPRNVLLEFGQPDLDDESKLRRMFDIQKQGVRIALRLDNPGSASAERLSYFPYLVAGSRRTLPPGLDPRAVSLVTLDDSTHDSLAADFAAGVHATAGWPLIAIPRREPQGLSPAQTAVFELIRLVQADADARDLERVFKGEPLLAYLLLTLANSAAFRRQTPVSSIGHAIAQLGYQRLTKWLVLLLAISGKDSGTAPLMFVAVARGHLMENLLDAARRPPAQCDDGFIVGAFSLLDAITGQSLADLLHGICLPETITDALLGGTGPFATLLEVARGFESADPSTLERVKAELNVDPADANGALLLALASADSLLSLIR